MFKTLAITCLFLLVILTGKAQTDTLFIKYDEHPGSEVLHPFENQDDSLDTDFPNSSLSIYVFEIEDKYLRFYYSSNPLNAIAHPFFYKKESIDELNEKVFFEKDWFERYSYSKAIKLFSPKDKIIMLWDSTQSEGEEVYLVRVYFDFNAYE